MQRWFRTPVDVAAVVFVLALAALTLAFMHPAPRKGAWLCLSCGSNGRQIAYAALAYANDWQDILPDRWPGGDPMLFAITRLPVIGFDTTTVWTWPAPVSRVRPPPAPAGRDSHPPALSGFSFVMRDYLKNDYEILYCPEGWIPRDGTFARDHFSPLVMGYHWLPHRTDRSAQCRGKVCSTDKPADIAHTAGDPPGLLLIADFTWRRLDHGDAFAANHLPRPGNMPPDYTPAGFPSAKPTDWPTFGAGRPVPPGTNVGRIDARVTWRPWQSVDTSRYVVNGSVLMW